MGADRAAAYVYQYGPPPAISALVSVAKVQRENDLWRMYMAEISWIPAARGLRKEKPPRFPDLLNELRGNRPAEDNRSSDEIIEDLKKKLRDRANERRHAN